MRINKYIELHAHLDGAITVDIAKELSKLQDIKLNANNDEQLLNMLSVPSTCNSLNDFLKCFDLPLTLLQTEKAITTAVYRVLENMRKDNVVYAELRFAPQLHTKCGLTQSMAVKAAIKGIEKASIPANIILCCMRGDNNDTENNTTVEIAHDMLTKHGGVVALDLAGAEGLYPTSKYTKIFEKANKYGIPFTIHAGEADGVESVISAIDMGAVRIGHGVRIAGNEEVMKMIADKKIYLEMCPTSNKITKAIQDMRDYPIIDFLNKGIKVTVNTDDSAIERTTLSDEFRYLEKEFGLSKKQELDIFNNSIEAAFTTQEIKEKLKKII